MHAAPRKQAKSAAPRTRAYALICGRRDDDARVPSSDCTCGGSDGDPSCRRFDAEAHRAHRHDCFIARLEAHGVAEYGWGVYRIPPSCERPLPRPVDAGNVLLFVLSTSKSKGPTCHWGYCSNCATCSRKDADGEAAVRIFEAPKKLRTTLRFFRVVAHPGSPPRWQVTMYNSAGRELGYIGQG
jgi:hypothetical protein